MNGIEYQQKLNRQNELYQKNIRDNNRANKTIVDNVQKTAEHKIQTQKKAHQEQINNLNKDFEKSRNIMDVEQKKVLADKSRVYEQAIDKNKVEASAAREKNLAEWREKVADIKTEFDRSLKEKDKANVETKNTLAENYKDNLNSVKSSSKKEIENYKELIAKKNQGNEGQVSKQFEELKEAHKRELHKNNIDKIRERNFVNKTVVADVNEAREAQEKEFNKNRAINKERIDKVQHDLNQRLDKEIVQKNQALEQAHTESIHRYNTAFTDRYRNLEEMYNKDVRNMDAKHRAQMISSGTQSKRILNEQRALERESFEEKKAALKADRDKLTSHLEKKLEENTRGYQEEMQDQRIEFSGKMVDDRTRYAEINARDNLRNRHQREKLAYDHKIQLKYEQDKAQSKIEDRNEITNQVIKNLKQDFARSYDLAETKSRQDLEQVKEDMIFEKRILQKRLHEQNSQQNSYLKKVYTDKLEGLRAGYEKQIADLENKVIQTKDNAEYWVQSTLKKMSDAMEREKQIVKDSAAAELETAARVAAEKEELNIKNKARTEALFNQRLNEQSVAAHRKLKEQDRMHSAEMKNEAKRYQDIIDQNNKYFNREIQRLQIASESEKERIVTQYEEQIAQLKRVNEEREENLKNFNKINA